MQAVLQKYGLPAHLINDWKNLIGVPLMRQMEIIFPDKDAGYHLELVTCYREMHDSKIIELCPLFEDLTEVLSRLKEDGVLLAIASSKRTAAVEIVLNYHDLSKYFSIVIGANDVANHKPHPESVLKILDILAIPNEQAVVIGDSSYDLDMARNAEVAAIGVTTGVHTAAVLALSNPLHIISRLNEVLQIIAQPRKF
jgi:phosphoglycolate phosphatase